MDVKKLINEIRETIESTANTTAIFGQAKKVEELSIIPVGSINVRGGGGGGGGQSPSKTVIDENGEESKLATDSGGGGGGGLKIKVSPVGYIEVRNDFARFIKIIDYNSLLMKGVKIFGAILILFSIRNLFRRK